MLEAAGNYSITELEMCGLAINITSFVHLLKRVDFDAVVDHLAITHIMKSKMEPATNRIKRLLEILSAYSFNLYYIKGKDMILSDLLSRQIEDDSNLHEIIPISFNRKEVLKETYLNISKDTYMVQTRSQTRVQLNDPTASNMKLIAQNATPKVTTSPMKAEKEKETETPPSRIVQQPPKGIVLPPAALVPPVDISPSVSPPPKPPNVDSSTTSPSLGPEPMLDIEENSPHQEGIIMETYVSPD